MPFTASMSSTGRGAIRGIEISEAVGRRAVGEHRDRGGLREHAGDPALDAADLRVVEVLGERALPGALGDDGAQRLRVRGGLEQQLAADGEAEAADARRIDVRAGGAGRRGGAQVAFARPAEGVVVALARALAAAVEQEHAVAVADEHPRVRYRLRAAREGDDRRAVARRDVPGVEPDSRRSSTSCDLTGRGCPRATAVDGRARLVRGDDRDRRSGARPGRRGRGRRGRRARVARAAGASEPVVRRVRQSGRDAEQRRGRCRRAPPSTAVTSSPLTRSTSDVADAVGDAADDRERAGEDREPAAEHGRTAAARSRSAARRRPAARAR